MTPKYMIWRKSSRSGDANGNCVEVAVVDRTVGVRDSKDRRGPILEFGGDAWAAFTGAVRGGALRR